MELVTRRFLPRDVFFNNGLVNLYRFCKEKKFDFHIELTENYLELVEDDNLYDDIFIAFIKDYKLVYETNNYRWYFNEKHQKFEKNKRYDILNPSSTDVRNTTIYIEPKIDNNELLKRLKKFGEQENFDIYKENDKLSYKPIFLKENELKKKKLNKLITLEEFANAYKNYLIKSNYINIDSKIHPFETGKYKSLFNMLTTNAKQKIDKWEALIYLFGNKINRYFIRSQEKKGKEYIHYVLLPNSSNLKSLYLLKKDLKIPNESITYKTKNDKHVDTYSNIDFYNQLSKDEIKKQKFYESKSIEELELKFFMFLFSKIYHIEKEYKDIKDEELAFLFDEDTFNYSKMLFDAVQKISFVTYSYDKNFKYSLNEYTKTYKLMMFFLKLKEKELFSYLGELLYQVSISKKRNLVEQKEAYNQNIVKLSDAILNFRSIVKILYDVSYDILQTDEENKKTGLYKRLGYKLYEFLTLYSKTINNIGENMSIHEESKKLGQQIGDFVANTKDKDLLFKIRNIKNFKQMVAFLKDVEFAFLKDYKEDKKDNHYLDTKKVLELLNEESENWDLIKDYMAIYAIEQFKYKI